jgi:hypothetical protein
MRHPLIRRPTSLAGTLFGLAVSYAFPLIAGAVFGLTLVYLAVRPYWSDQTWLLFAARRVLDGAQLGFEDIAEENPPLIIWLSTIPVSIGRALDIRLPASLQGCIAALVAFSVIWSTSLLRRECAADSKRFAGWFALVLLFATVVHPWLYYGQREQILLLLVLPYLVMAAGRIEGQAPPTGEAVVAGLCGGIGFLLKPHHLLVVLAVEGLLLIRGRHVRSLYRPEVAAMIATGLGYAAAICLWAPDYLLKLVPLALNTIYDYHRAELSELILPIRWLKMAIVALLWAILYRRLAHGALATVLLLAGVSATVAHVVQLKAFDYHLVPAIAFFDLLFGVIVIDCWLHWVARRPLPIPVGLAATAAMLMFAGTIALCYPLQLARAARSAPDDRNTVLRALSHDIPRNATVLILSTSPETFFEQVLDRNWQWASRFMSLWTVPAIVKAERAAGSDGTAVPAVMRDAAVLTRNAVSADLTRWQPNPVLVERCQDATFAQCRGMDTIRLDLLQWLEQGAGFAAAWSHYVREGQIGPYDLWCREGESEVCRRILANQEAVR